MQTVQVKSKKGGVGKSLFAREMATLLAAVGCHVLLMDCSEQANDDILENQQRPFEATIKECILSGVPFVQAARQVRKNLWLVAGSREHGEINAYIRKEWYPQLIHDMMEDLRSQLVDPLPYEHRFPWWQSERVSMSIFHVEPTDSETFLVPPDYLDYVIIDSDASTEDELTFVLWDAIDGIIVPYELTELDWQSYFQLKQDLAKRYQRRIEQMPPILGILPNKVLHTKDNPTPLIYLKTMYRDVPEQVFRPVHWSKIFGECLNLHIGSLEHTQAFTDRAVRELCAIVLEWIGYPGELSGLKLCPKCTEALMTAVKEREAREQEQHEA